MLRPRWLASLRRHLRGFQAISLWHHELYRLPIPALESAVGFDTRRVDYAFWYLLDSGSIPERVVRRPSKASLEKVGLAHELDWFETLCEPEALARAFQLAPEDGYVTFAVAEDDRLFDILRFQQPPQDFEFLARLHDR